MMTCQDMQEKWLTEFLDDVLPASKKAEVEQHLSSCAACREVVARARILDAALAEGRDTGMPGEHVWASISHKIEEDKVSVFDLVRGWLDVAVEGWMPQGVYVRAATAFILVCLVVAPTVLTVRARVAVAEKEELVQLVYADIDTSGADESVGRGTLVEEWL